MASLNIYKKSNFPYNSPVIGRKPSLGRLAAQDNKYIHLKSLHNIFLNIKFDPKIKTTKLPNDIYIYNFFPNHFSTVETSQTNRYDACWTTSKDKNKRKNKKKNLLVNDCGLSNVSQAP